MMRYSNTRPANAVLGFFGGVLAQLDPDFLVSEPIEDQFEQDLQEIEL